MKRYIFLFFLTIFIFAHQLIAQNKKPLVVATASMIADMAENVAGEFIELKTIVPIGGDPHIYEPTPGDAVLASKADLVLRNGLTFEGWLNELIENSGTKANLILVTDGVIPITSVVYKNAPDPHAWMDATNGVIYAENIKNAIIKLIPEYSKEIEFNFNAYKSTLLSLDQYIKTSIEKIPKQKRVLITSHDAFQYYGRAYGLTLESILGTSTDAQAQTSDIVRLNKVIQSSGVPAVFIETTVNPKLLAQIAKDNHVRIGGKLFSDSIGELDSEAPTYVDMLKYNTETIVTALTLDERTPNGPSKSNKSGDALSKWIWFIPIALIGAIAMVFLMRKNS